MKTNSQISSAWRQQKLSISTCNLTETSRTISSLWAKLRGASLWKICKLGLMLGLMTVNQFSLNSIHLILQRNGFMYQNDLSTLVLWLMLHLTSWFIFIILRLFCNLCHVLLVYYGWLCLVKMICFTPICMQPRGFIYCTCEFFLDSLTKLKSIVYNQ